jgi:hypothetical protein
MISPKLGDGWLPNILNTIDKETHHTILDLGSSVLVLSSILLDHIPNRLHILDGWNLPG